MRLYDICRRDTWILTLRVKVCRIVDAWLSTPFEGGRHRRRIDKIIRFEKVHWKE